MNKMTIQVPVDKSIKLSAEKVALEQGFSSLQEAIRVFMVQLAKKSLSIGFSPRVSDQLLTDEQEKILTKKYNQAKKEIKSAKGFIAHSAEEMMHQLRS